MKLDPRIQEYLAQNVNEPRLWMLDAAAARASRSSSRLELWPDTTECVTTEIDIQMHWGTCKARLYRPAAQSGQTLPLVMYYHGGGFVICDLDTHDEFARGVCSGAGVVVLSVDYRLAPEHIYPAAQDDAVDSLKWAHGAAVELGIDPSRILVCGDSAGANLAIGVARRSQHDESIPRLRGQVLFYPVTDAPDAGHSSYAQFAEGYGLTAKDMHWFWGHYMGADAAGTCDVAHLHATDLSGLPPAIVFTAAYDVLRDEGEAFAYRLAQEGVLTTLKRCPGLHHNFMAFAQSVPDAGVAGRDACDWIKAQIFQA